MSATTNLGKVSVTPKGAWAITNTYEILDIVTSGGSSYLAKQDVPTGVPLSNTSYWIMIAEKGDGGEVTSASASISGGYGTPGVTVTAGGTAHERTLAFAFTNLRGEKGETGNGIDSVYKTGTSGLVDTYTILFTDGSTYEFEVNNGTASIDNTLAKSGWAADAKVVGDTKASIDGFYETMGVGVADNLTPYSEDSGATQDIPFIAQGTGCGNGASVVDTGSYMQAKKKLGNTVCVNQYVANANRSFTGGTTGQTTKTLGTFYLVSGHTYLAHCIQKTTYTSIERNTFFVRSTGSSFTSIYESGQVNYKMQAGARFWLFTSNATGAAEIAFWTVNANVAGEYENVAFHDVTQLFGSNDRIPADLIAHPENWGRYYAGSLAYNAGTLDSADGSILTSLPRNCFNGTVVIGKRWSSGSYINIGVNNYAANNELIPCSPNTAYAIALPSNDSNTTYAYLQEFDRNGNWMSASSAISISSTNLYNTFTTSPETFFIAFSFWRSSNFTSAEFSEVDVSRYYSGESGYDKHYPFSVLAEVDTGSEVLRGVEGSRDEKLPSGAIKRNRARIDLGTLTYGKKADGVFYSWGLQNSIAVLLDNSAVGSLISSKYVAGSYNDVYINSTLDKAIAIGHEGQIAVADLAFNDANALKTALSGQYLEYPLATPTTEQGTAFAKIVATVKGGELSWTNTKGIPVGQESHWFENLRKRVEDRLPDPPSADGTYRLTCTISGGVKTYSWEA